MCRTLHTSFDRPHTPCRHVHALVPVAQGTAETLCEVEELLAPLAKARKVQPSPYALQVRPVLYAGSCHGSGTGTQRDTLLERGQKGGGMAKLRWHISWANRQVERYWS